MHLVHYSNNIIFIHCILNLGYANLHCYEEIQPHIPEKGTSLTWAWHTN